MIEKILAKLEDYKYSHLVEHDSERIEHCKEQEGHCEGSDCFLCIWDRAIEIVQEVARDGGWIPCSERLPKETGNYLVSSKGTIWVANWFNYTWWGIEKRCRWTDIEAWQPLPAPFKKGE